MAKNEFNWGEGLFYDGTGDGRKKRKKDPYENPLGLSGETPGMPVNSGTWAFHPP